MFVLFPLLRFFFMFSYVTGRNTFPQPLSPEKEKEYLERYQNGDNEAKDALIEHNLRLVAHIAKKYNNQTKIVEDLISIGAIGLIKAITTYKQGKGTKLATYAARCIENEILMNLRASKKHQNDVYLQDVIGVDREGNEVRVEDKLSDDDESIIDRVDTQIQVDALGKALSSSLKGREKSVIDLRYGLDGQTEMTQREIAELLGISRSYVSRIEKKALKKLGTIISAKKTGK